MEIGDKGRNGIVDIYVSRSARYYDSYKGLCDTDSGMKSLTGILLKNLGIFYETWG